MAKTRLRFLLSLVSGAGTGASVMGDDAILGIPGRSWTTLGVWLRHHQGKVAVPPMGEEVVVKMAPSTGQHLWQ